MARQASPNLSKIDAKETAKFGLNRTQGSDESLDGDGFDRQK